MLTKTHSGSLLHLIAGLREESKTFLHQEVQLAKTEMSEKASAMGRNAVFVAVGGFVAYAGAILLFIGLSLLLVFAFEKLGISHEIALFAGPLVLGAVIGIIGYILIQKGLHAISSTQLVPVKTIETLTGERIPAKNEEKEKDKSLPKASSTAIKTKAEHTRDHLESTVAEIRHRMSPGHIRDTVVLKVKENPVPTAAITIGGLVGLWFVRHRRHATAIACSRE